MVTIARDTHGVPHISGPTEADAAFGFGYAQAQDHLDLMLRNYMEASGRLAEIDGEAALETDVRTRLWRTTEKAEAAYPKLNSETRAYLDAFVNGVNRYMTDHPENVPRESDSVTSVQVIALYRLLHIRLNEWTMPELGLLQNGGMSNQWAIAPSRTVSNETICAMDPHVPWVPIFRMYEAHLTGDDGFNVYGAAPFGLPTIILGHTSRHAWSITINRCDTSDMYIERTDPDNPLRYRYQDHWRKIDTWETRIRIKTTDGIREERRMLDRTHHGPIIARYGETAYTIRMSAYEIIDPITPLLGLARADSLQAFKQSLASLDIPMFNILYGDNRGDLFYVYNERCPVRSEEYDWRKPVAGWTDRTEWQMNLPFGDLPQIENPPGGFLQNCNNAPWYVSPGDVIRRSDFPAYAVFEEYNGRAQRMYEWLLNNENVAVDHALDMVVDEYNTTAGHLKPLLLDSYKQYGSDLEDPDGHMAGVVAILSDWNNVGDVSSFGMSVFAHWKIKFDELDDGTENAQLMLRALQRTITYMIDRYGRIDIAWGQIHVLKRGQNTYPTGGSSAETESIRPVRGRFNEDGIMVADYGSAFTMVVSLGQTPAAWSLVPYGNSERSDSPHYADQAPLWTERRLKRAWFTPEEIEANLETREELERD